MRSVVKNLLIRRPAVLSWLLAVLVVALITFRQGFEQGIIRVSMYVERGSNESQNRVKANIQSIFSPPLIPVKNCSPKHDIVFLKTHKASSSAVQNILMRYGWMRGLKFALVPPEPYSWPLPFRRSMVMETGPNILCHHIVFNHSELQSVMPADSTYITILRDPATHLESWYTFYNHEKRHFRGASFEDFIRDPQHHIDRLRYRRGPGRSAVRRNKQKQLALRKKDMMARRAMRNMQLFDLGLVSIDERDPSHWSADLIQKHIHVIEREFHLVMIAELFLESLVLLKELLCWDLVDVVVFSHNARMDVYKPNSNVLERSSDHARNWSLADSAAHRYFTHQLLMKIRAFGEDRMRREVEQLEYMASRLFDQCVQFTETQSEQHDERYLVFSDKTKGYRIREDKENNKTCQSLLFSERGFTKILLGKLTNKSAKIDLVPRAFT